MAVQEDSTKRGLTGSFHQRTYGTVKDDFSHSPNPKNSKVLIHEVKPTDTLQGIALKYDVSVSLGSFPCSLVPSNPLVELPVPRRVWVNMQQDASFHPSRPYEIQEYKFLQYRPTA